MSEQGNLVIREPQVFSGYNYLGSCREFVWKDQEASGKYEFQIRRLNCMSSLDNQSLKKDLYLCAPSGEEFVIKNFRLADVSDPENLTGKATKIQPLTEAFPETRTAIAHRHGMVTRDAHITAIRAVSTMINAVKSETTVKTQSTVDAAGKLVADVVKSPDALINLMAVKSFDDYTYAHAVNVAMLAINIGVSLKLHQEDLHVLAIGALLHDIGKLRIPLGILNRKGPLSDTEIERIRSHPQVGFNLLQKSKDLPEAARLIALQHHEKFGGGGYPCCLPGETSSLLARIVSVADVYDALTSKRPFRPPFSPYQAMRVLLSNTSNHFDPAVLGVFVQRMSLFPPGSRVRLSNGAIAMVVRPNLKGHMRPVVRYLRDPNGMFSNDQTEHDLMAKGNPSVLGSM